MTPDEALALQGHHVSVALANSARLDDVILEGVVEGEQLWLHLDGRDVFVAVQDVLEVWEPRAARDRHGGPGLAPLGTRGGTRTRGRCSRR